MIFYRAIHHKNHNTSPNQYEVGKNLSVPNDLTSERLAADQCTNNLCNIEYVYIKHEHLKWIRFWVHANETSTSRFDNSYE